MTESHQRVLLCGPFEAPGVVGGYARNNSLLATSAELSNRIIPVPLSVPGRPLPVRLFDDLHRVLLALLRAPDARIVHLTAQYRRGTYREFLIYLLARLFSRRFLFDIRAGSFIGDYEAAGPIRRTLLATMVRGADALAVEGQAYVDWIRQRFGIAAVLIPNVVLSAAETLLSPAPLDRPGEGESIRLVMTGRLIPEKGVGELVDALGLLQSSGIRAELHLVGPIEPGYKEEIDQESVARDIGNRIIWHGPLSHQEVFDVLRRCHIFVFPSRWPSEGHSNAVNEAMQVGLPLIVSDRGFLRSVVDSTCAVVLREISGPAIANAVESIAGDWARLQQMGVCARRRVYSAFSDRVVLPTLKRIYDEPSR